ncbi:hypothetical protein FHG87_010200 [Trinorchestia longiramus]|nr:hypothetical protein FHG87_010200 [Trinorchestia longiramus]
MKTQQLTLRPPITGGLVQGRALGAWSSSKPVGHLVINYSEGRLREAVLSQASNMKLQLLVIACLIALSSVLAAKSP